MMKQEGANKWEFYGKIVWLYTKYQLMTKTLLALFIFPIYKLLLKTLIFSSGRVSISSGDYLYFLLSPQGIGLLLISLLLLTLLVGLDINAFIIMSALIKENRIELTARHLFLVGIKSLKSFMTPAGFLIIVYIGLIIPIVGVGFGVSIMENFKIPNFITDVIFKNKLYLSFYLITLILLMLITIRYTFFFHYLLVENNSIKNSFKKSSKLIRNHWKEFIKYFILRSVFLYVLLGFIILIIFMGLYGYLSTIKDSFYQRFFTIFITISITEVSAYFALMFIPFISYRLTKLFYQFNYADGYEVTLKLDVKAKHYDKGVFRKIKLRTKISITLFLIILTIFNLFSSAFFSVYFDDIFKHNKRIEIVAHRGGGDLAAENSVLGMKKAINMGASWSEIDVQRTKDGYYIINHDPTFTRVSGVNKKSTDLTLAEIKKMKIKDLFNSSGKEQPIATLEEFLEASKGKIGLFIELKGSTADKKMVDDVVSMVKEKNMLNDIAIISLDYSLISYIEKKYPEIKTGYLYFFSIGDINKINADILIMEEEEATEDKIEAIHKNGKKAIVWTVNTDDSVDKFVLSDVDGIITDYVGKVKDGIKKRDYRNDFEVIIDKIME